MMARMIATIVQTGFRSLRRDRVAFILSFVLPVAFFTIFGFVFGNMRSSSTPRVSVLVVDQDKSSASRALISGLLREPSLEAATHPKPTKENPAPQDYTAATAEAAVRNGAAPAALIIPSGFSSHPISFVPGSPRLTFQILNDTSDPVAAQVLAGMLQKTVMMSLPATMATAGSQYFDQAIGGLTPQQRQQMDASVAALRRLQDQQSANAAQTGSGAAAKSTTPDFSGFVSVNVRDVVGEKKRSPMISYYAAAVGVMFLLFTASGASGSLLDESDSGALDRILSARVTMATLLAGKVIYSTLLAFLQLMVMFLWAAAIFHLDLFTHIPGFIVMTAATSFAVAAFGILLASVTRTRAQLAAFSTLIILTMSAVGGSMFPRFLMPDAMKNVGLFTFNSWAIEGYTKVFWRDQPVRHLGPEVSVLLASGFVLFLLARWFARRWESA
jgi:linearmycin/streptolysin S transport system permease protein